MQCELEVLGFVQVLLTQNETIPNQDKIHGNIDINYLNAIAYNVPTQHITKLNVNYRFILMNYSRVNN